MRSRSELPSVSEGDYDVQTGAMRAKRQQRGARPSDEFSVGTSTAAVANKKAAVRQAPNLAHQLVASCHSWQLTSEGWSGVTPITGSV